MRFEDIIEKKRDKKELTREEIHFWISNYVKDEIPDYQVSSLLMAIYLNGMNNKEIGILTDEMRMSGQIWDLSDIPGLKVDKHSTGGVGDKVSLVLGPMIAACGAKLAKMSGRGLGHTGGTLDKLESIPGLDIHKTYEDFKKQVNEIGLAIIGQDENIDPADKKIYALRDVTGTVGSIPLIASSVMSKKLASGADCILLDVKYGSGAFMKNIDDAKVLAQTMVDIGKELHKDVKAEITDMDQPLGMAIGNNLEVKEAIATLKGEGPKDLTELCISSGIILLKQAKVFDNDEDAKNALINSIKSGTALNKLKEMVEYQKGASEIIPIYSKVEGYVHRIDALEIGKSSMRLGGGRETLDDIIDMSAGIILNKKIGDFVKKDELLATLYTNKKDVEGVKQDVKNAFDIRKEEVKIDMSKKIFIE